MSRIADAFNRWLPKTDAPSLVKASLGTEKVTARVDITEADVCPVCKATMSKADASGVAVYVCHKDRVVLPQQD